MNFRLTARDGLQGGGGFGIDDTVITVSGAPFSIASPNGGETIGAGCPLDVLWTVGGGSVASNVDLSFSSDGGSSFSTLVSHTPNDGSETGSTCDMTSTARAKAEAVGNIFFDISDDEFEVVSTPPSVSASAMGGEVDENCEFDVQFYADVSDDCGISASDVIVDFFKAQNNFTLGVPVVNAQQVNGTTVSVTGSILVSDVVNSPAVLTIEVTGADACGVEDADSVQIQVEDNIPPTIDVELSPKVLWPPNHRMKNISVTAVVMDNCPGPTFELVSVTSSEPDNGIADGNTVNDIQGAAVGTPDLSFRLRAERAGNGPGRVYTATYSATDASNNQAVDSDTVAVPHNK